MGGFVWLCVGREVRMVVVVVVVIVGIGDGSLLLHAASHC